LLFGCKFYPIEEELKAALGASAHPNLAGYFAIHFTDALGDMQTHHIPADQTAEIRSYFF